MKLMRVLVRPRSIAESKRHPRAKDRGPQAKALAPGFQPTPQHDLKFRGGRTIPHLAFTNFFVGGAASWQQSDIDNINHALAGAMSDPKLNNVMAQYFTGAITTNFIGSQILVGKKPKKVTETSAHKMITDLLNAGKLKGVSLPSTVVNLLLPSGTVLTDGTGPGKEHDDPDDTPGSHPKGAPESEEATSLEGLGGYHGSVDVGAQRVYYAVGVFSQILPNGKENGIAVFDQPWKNVVATFYHELNEARTDPDVDDAIRQ